MRSYRVLKPFAKQAEPLGPLTTMRVGGPADLLARPTNVRQLADVLRVAADEGHPVRMIGGGSNVLISDEGVNGVVIQLRAGYFRRVEFHKTSPITKTFRKTEERATPTARVYAAAGANLPRLVHEACRRGLGGLVNLAGVPGTVGGALRGNAGTRYGEIGDYVKWVEVLEGDGGPDGEPIRLTREEANFRYRATDLEGLVVLGCELELPLANADDLLSEMRQLNMAKTKTQPLALRSAGCIFKNPEGDSAGRLIDSMGFKGRRYGEASVSDRHANFILNMGAARSADVLDLSEEIRRAAFEQHGVKLNYEVKIWRRAA